MRQNSELLRAISQTENAMSSKVTILRAAARNRAGTKLQRLLDEAANAIAGATLPLVEAKRELKR